MIKLNRPYTERGRSGRLKKRPIPIGGLWGALQANEKVEVGEFNLDIFKSEIYNFFQRPVVDKNRPIRMLISIPAKSEKAGKRKLRKQFKNLKK